MRYVVQVLQYLSAACESLPYDSRISLQLDLQVRTEISALVVPSTILSPPARSQTNNIFLSVLLRLSLVRFLLMHLHCT